MLRSMYSGISGLRNFQTKLDVIGNNIANVNTYGFKKGRTIFKDLISQTVAGASGLEIHVVGLTRNKLGLVHKFLQLIQFIQVALHNLQEIHLDLAISGDGFFQVVKMNADGN